ncbi:hypothetical protein HEP87_58440 [Streptomyces sp. S1D4-11]
MNQPTPFAALGAVVEYALRRMAPPPPGRPAAETVRSRLSPRREGE